jgi:hypothetical protein
MKQPNIYDDYSFWTDNVAIYPKVHEPHYLALGLVEEMGELYRAATQDDIIAEAGDVLWYAARYARLVLKVPFVDIAIPPTSYSTASVTPMEALATIAGVEKKRLRDGETWNMEKLAAKEADARAALELVVYVALALAFRRAGASPRAVIEANHAKLSARLAASKIRGDGDHR